MAAHAGLLAPTGDVDAADAAYDRAIGLDAGDHERGTLPAGAPPRVRGAGTPPGQYLQAVEAALHQAAEVGAVQS